MNDTPKPKRGRPSKMDGEKTADVAMHAYWAADPVDVSINAICEKAGVSKPALYREFGSEDGLMRAVLDRYAVQVLSEIFEILQPDRPLTQALDALIEFASVNPKMETGCVFFKMRAGKHRLGPKTREGVDAVDAGAVAAFTTYLDARRDAGDWTTTQPVETLARYLVEQVGLALMQRAVGHNPAQIKATMTLSLSVIKS